MAQHYTDSRQALKLLRNGAPKHGILKFKYDNESIRPSHIDRIVNTIYDDLSALALSGAGIYAGSGSLVSNTIVSQGTNVLNFNALGGNLETDVLMRHSVFSVNSEDTSTNKIGSIAATAAAAQLRWRDQATSNSSEATLTEDSLAVSLNRFAGSKIVEFTTTSMLVTDSLSSKGLQYAADYSANYTTRSLTDKAYVDNSFSGLSETITFSGGSTGDVASLTLVGGLITAKTLVP